MHRRAGETPRRAGRLRAPVEEVPDAGFDRASLVRSFVIVRRACVARAGPRSVAHWRRPPL